MQELEPGTESPQLQRNLETAQPVPGDDESAPSPCATSRMPLAGEIAFVSAEAQVQRTAELLGEGAMVVEIPAPPASMRGRLSEHVDYAIERALGICGAPSPYLTEGSTMAEDAEARFEDQLFRARTMGATGIALAMGSLARIAAPALTPEDSATLRSLACASEQGPVVLLVDDGDEATGGYGEPVRLVEMLGARRVGVRVGVEVAAGGDGHGDGHGHEDEDDGAGESEVVETHVDAPVAPVEVRTAAQREAARATRRATAGVPVAGPADYWRSWAIALGAARGPQPLAAFERLFVESYMPLANAIAAGLDDPRAIRAHDEFKTGFERTYTDAFATFGATGRRPRLVMDAYDVALKQARLHNARTTHVLVVDAMRHDLGCLVRDELATRAAGTVSLTSESLLWSSLPTTTYRQLETLARGMEALKAPAAEETTESLRGRSAETVRRLRVGSRELYKLDVVPSMLSALPDRSASPSPAHIVAALAEIASSVADGLLRHIETLPPRTLLLILGDHGFTVDRRGRIEHGGATPEEVLVPCLAYLVGDLH
jgi:hypothetical protein